MMEFHQFKIVYSIATRLPHLSLCVTYRGCTQEEALEAHAFILYMGGVIK